MCVCAELENLAGLHLSVKLLLIQIQSDTVIRPSCFTVLPQVQCH